MIAISGCLSAPSNKEMEEFAEKVIKVVEQLNKLRKEFIESLNQTSAGTITEKKEEIKPEEFDAIDIQLIKSLCEYIAIKGMVNFFKNNK